MDWIEITDEDGVEIDGTRYDPGARVELPYRAALPLVSGARAQFVHGPNNQSSDEVAALDGLDFTALDGISDERAADVRGYLREAGIETREALLEGDLTALPHIGEELANRLRERLS